MKHVIIVNQAKAIELGITHINQAHIFDLLTGVSTWSKPEVIDEEVYYWVSRQRICAELPLLDMKPDTVYRHLKKLAEAGLIEYLKRGKKDCVRLTPKGKTYYVGNKSEFTENAMSDLNPNHYVGNKSEFTENAMSDLNPNHYVGNESEFTENTMSDLNPTDPTISNKNIKEKINKKEISEKSKPPEQKKSSRFAKPSVEEIRTYCRVRNNRVNPQAFFDYYEANGWMVGRTKMKDWQAAVRTWEQREKKYATRISGDAQNDYLAELAALPD